ncbi:TlpA disulfide reductase family protein [Dyadobacter sp. CY323]|uniref:TlpA family protein disulfide reductase n=1 Tax=Dyadobacter sp. CY323 TaxID=2907302 RepID=UPI001F392BC4|nr:TlpA disulfide reductase family protein [Dyadobacter sp. CY323]MCE6991047.1 TlpA family protein disulfide reductase [Dyadobacter sp. CY323]
MKKRSVVFLALAAFLIGTVAFAQDRELKVGDVAPEISLPTPKGDTARLSSMRGRLVLIDFWASWCAPCVEEQPELKKLYTKYAKQNGLYRKFQIFGVSLDSKKEGWQKIIRKYNIPWTQVSDLKFWTSPIAQDYHIDALPFNVLIDEKGFVVAVNLHGEKLENFIGEYLSKEI